MRTGEGQHAAVEVMSAREMSYRSKAHLLSSNSAAILSGMGRRCAVVYRSAAQSPCAIIHHLL
jgi:hypothetical protein